VNRLAIDGIQNEFSKKDACSKKTQGFWNDRRILIFNFFVPAQIYLQLEPQTIPPTKLIFF